MHSNLIVPQLEISSPNARQQFDGFFFFLFVYETCLFFCVRVCVVGLALPSQSAYLCQNRWKLRSHTDERLKKENRVNVNSREARLLVTAWKLTSTPTTALWSGESSLFESFSVLHKSKSNNNNKNTRCNSKLRLHHYSFIGQRKVKSRGSWVRRSLLFHYQQANSTLTTTSRWFPSERKAAHNDATFTDRCPHSPFWMTSRVSSSLVCPLSIVDSLTVTIQLTKTNKQTNSIIIKKTGLSFASIRNRGTRNGTFRLTAKAVSFFFLCFCDQHKLDLACPRLRLYYCHISLPFKRMSKETKKNGETNKAKEKRLKDISVSACTFNQYSHTASPWTFHLFCLHSYHPRASFERQTPHSNCITVGPSVPPYALHFIKNTHTGTILCIMVPVLRVCIVTKLSVT